MKKAILCVLACLLANTAGADSLESPGLSIPTGATRFTADLVQRHDGAWVIAKLNASDAPLPGGSPLAEQPVLAETLARYRQALSRGDLDALSAVWLMNPSERAQLERVAANPFSISISQAFQQIDGNRARVSFLQHASVAANDVRRKPSRRRLSANDSVGHWTALAGR